MVNPIINEVNITPKPAQRFAFEEPMIADHQSSNKSIFERIHTKRTKIEKIKLLEDSVKKLGGLGSPHVGGAEWNNKKEL